MTDENITPAAGSDDVSTVQDSGTKPVDESPPDTEPDKPADRRDHRYRQRLRETEAQLQSEREQWEQQRTEMQQTIASYQKADIARETGVPAEEIIGDTAEEMRESAQEYRQRIDAAVEAEMRLRNIGPAAPASAVTSNGKPESDEAPSDWVSAFAPRD